MDTTIDTFERDVIERSQAGGPGRFLGLVVRAVPDARSSAGGRSRQASRAQSDHASGADLR